MKAVEELFSKASGAVKELGNAAEGGFALLGHIIEETVIPAPKAREEQVIPQELRNVPTAKSLDADVGSAELPDLFDSLIIAPAATPKLDMDLSEGDKVHVWSKTKGTWIEDGKILEISQYDVQILGDTVTKGSVYVLFDEGNKSKWVCFPLLSPRLDPTLVAALGLVVIGLAIGCELIDLCFDFLIHWDTPLKIGDRTISAREVGFLYYNNILKGKHVNFAIEIFLLTSQFGALVGSSRTSHQVRQAWLGMVLTMISGNGFYLTSVVTRYVDLRLATHFEERFFDGWSRVIAARFFLLMHLFTAVFLLCTILVKMQRQAMKSHEK